VSGSTIAGNSYDIERWRTAMDDPAPTAPQLVREVRAAESRIDHVDSFHVKLARHWHKPPEGIAHRQAELRNAPESTP
jgi:hypothetical protein